jgi:thiamine biosynthesis lipoprotein ApbE
MGAVRDAPLAAAGWTAIGTGIRLVVTDPPALDRGRALLEEYLGALDEACSRFRPDSELSRLPGAAGRPVTVSPVLAGALGAALRGAVLTGGDVDPTVGLAMAAAGYDRDFSLLPADGPAGRVTVRRHPSWRDIVLDDAARTLTVPVGVCLDLGATAKAWAADQAAARLAAELDCGVLVSLGGDICVAGPAPAGGWPVRVQDVTGDPGDPAPDASVVVAISEGGLATSSTTARRWRRGGAVLHHILDPRSGLPAPPVWRLVSVAAGTALDANVASTAAIIRGLAAPAWLAELGVAARLVTAGGAVITTGGWPEEELS